MATAPLLAVLMLGRLGFPPWQYGLAFAAPCVGGLIGSRLARRLVARFGPAPGHAHRRDAARRAGRSGWPSSAPASAGLVLVIAVQLGLVTCMGVFNPVLRHLASLTSPRRARDRSSPDPARAAHASPRVGVPDPNTPHLRVPPVTAQTVT